MNVNTPLFVMTTSEACVTKMLVALKNI